MRTTLRFLPLALGLGLGPAAHGAEQVIRIGSASPSTGPSAHLGKDTENGARLAVADLNAKGTLINGQKVRFELLAEDDGGDPKQGTAVAQKLVDAGVVGVIGHLNSGTTVPASKIYHTAGIPQITPSATKASSRRFGWWPTTKRWAARWAAMRSTACRQSG